MTHDHRSPRHAARGSALLGALLVIGLVGGCAGGSTGGADTSSSSSTSASGGALPEDDSIPGRIAAASNACLEETGDPDRECSSGDAGALADAETSPVAESMEEVCAELVAGAPGGTAWEVTGASLMRPDLGGVFTCRYTAQGADRLDVSYLLPAALPSLAPKEDVQTLPDGSTSGLLPLDEYSEGDRSLVRAWPEHRVVVSMGPRPEPTRAALDALAEHVRQVLTSS